MAVVVALRGGGGGDFIERVEKGHVSSLILHVHHHADESGGNLID